jgi:hypothetical protein
MPPYPGLTLITGHRRTTRPSYYVNFSGYVNLSTL